MASDIRCEIEFFVKISTLLNLSERLERHDIIKQWSWEGLPWTVCDDRVQEGEDQDHEECWSFQRHRRTCRTLRHDYRARSPFSRSRSDEYSTHNDTCYVDTLDLSISINQSIRVCLCSRATSRLIVCVRNVRMIMSGYDFLKSQVLSCWRKVESVCDVIISSGRVFQTRGPATVNARSPTVERLTDGTIRRLVPPERNVRRPGWSATGTSGPRYRGALPCKTLYFVIDPLRDAQPVKAGKSVGDMVRGSHTIDQPCCRIQNRL